MRAKLIGIFVCMLLVGTVLPISGKVMVEKSPLSFPIGKTLYVGGGGPGNYSHIWLAINDASDGDTVFVYDDSSPYFEHLSVDKSINLIGENKDTTVIDGDGIADVIEIKADGVHVSGFTLQNSGEYWQNAGIDVMANNAIITNNNIKDCCDGINLFENRINNIISDNSISSTRLNGIGLWYSSNYNSIFNNTFYSNNENSIEAFHCGNNTITGNLFNSNEQGIFLSRSNNNIISDNIFESSKRSGILVSGVSNNVYNNCLCNDGIYLSVSINEKNFIYNNTVNEKSLLYLEHESDKVIDTEAGQIILVYCNNITIQNQELTNTYQGIQLEGSDNCLIVDNILSNNYYGIQLCPGNRENHIVGNTISNNEYGISGPTSETKIEGNIISNNGYGIHLYVGWNNKILRNTISNNNYGIKLEYSALNNISYNNFIKNKRDAGFHVFHSYRNNSWDNNYWQRPRIFPILIFGKMRLWDTMLNIPWLHFDMNPAKEPFDI